LYILSFQHAVEYLLKKQIKDFEEEISKEKDNPLTLTNNDSIKTGDKGDNSLPNPLGTTVAQFYTDMYDYFGDSSFPPVLVFPSPVLVFPLLFLCSLTFLSLIGLF
jgi:hypothetical protein